MQTMFCFLNDIQEDGAPYIKGNSPELSDCTEFSIYIDGVDVAHCTTLLAAVSVYLACYYVFNLAYPAGLKKTLTFFQKVILNIHDNAKIERSVVTLLERLNQHLVK